MHQNRNACSPTNRACPDSAQLSAAESSKIFKTAFELRNARACCCVPAAAVAALQKVIRYARNHCAVVAAKFKRRENAVDVGALGKKRAQPAVRGNTAACNNSLKSRV